MNQIEVGKEYIILIEPDGDGTAVGELIRCKDCKSAAQWEGSPWIDCTEDHTRLMKPDGFCSGAERREEDETD